MMIFKVFLYPRSVKHFFHGIILTKAYTNFMTFSYLAIIFIIIIFHSSAMNYCKRCEIAIKLCFPSIANCSNTTRQWKYHLYQILNSYIYDSIS